MIRLPHEYDEHDINLYQVIHKQLQNTKMTICEAIPTAEVQLNEKSP